MLFFNSLGPGPRPAGDPAAELGLWGLKPLDLGAGFGLGVIHSAQRHPRLAHAL